MKLVIDANILFSATIRDSGTAELLLHDDLQLYAPEYLFQEFQTYRDTLLEKTHRTPEEFNQFLSVLENRIQTVPKEEFTHKLETAKDISPDEDDIQYFALALYLNAALWTDDKKLQEQEAVPVTTTTELIENYNEN